MPADGAEDADDGRPLSPSEAGEVLRYWLCALRYEEALTARPRAMRLDPRRPPSIDLREPRGGQSYFKLRVDDEVAAVLTRAAPTLERALDAELVSFFNRWLRLTYYRESAPGRAFEGDGRAVVVGWPVVFFPRTEELACLLRFRGTIGWRVANGEPFAVPSWRARKGGPTPAPPASVRVERSDEDDELLPFSLDTQLLMRTLGVNDEEVDDLHTALRAVEDLSPGRMIATVAGLLEGRAPFDGQVAPEPEGEAATSPALFARLTAAVRGRLGGGAAV
ncbi:MAG: hypothetical protein KC620_22755, partial [Myxococcales bacterium]|nr:hypothetical protein [Myxococcales bacterium]